MLLQAFQFGDSPMELTLDGILIADDFESVAGGWQGEGRGIGGVGMPTEISDVVTDFAGFGAEGAAQAPVRHGNFLHQHVFQDADRIEFFDQPSQEGIEVAPFFGAAADGQDHELRQQAISERVEQASPALFDTRFACRSPRAGGALCVAPVGLELLRASACDIFVPFCLQKGAERELTMKLQ
jgi:hypothetical protein